MVAESTEILAPIVQFGCAIAWLGVTLAISADECRRNGPPQALNAVEALAAQGLEDGVVLRIHRQKHGPARLDFIEQECARADQGFLGGERDHDAASYRGKGGLQSGRADDRRHDPVSRPLGGLDQTRRAGSHLDFRSAQGLLERIIGRRIPDDCELRAMTQRGVGQAFDVVVAGQRDHLVALGRGADQIERALTDRSRGAENGDAAPLARRMG